MKGIGVFALASVTNEGTFRRFAFELVGSGPPRRTVVVVADMELVRKYGIPLQELPLLCLRLLESGGDFANATVIFTEQEMIAYADRRLEEKTLAEQKRRGHPPRPPRTTGT